MLRILIADDEKFERDALMDIIIGAFGDTVGIVQAANGEDAVRLALAHEVDIAFLDIKMPLLDGIEAARRIRAALPGCRMIIQTGYTYFKYAQESISLGVMEFLVKPTTDEDIILVVRRAIALIDAEQLDRASIQAGQERLRRAQGYMRSELVSTIALSNPEEPAIRELMASLDLTFSAAYAVIVRCQTPEREGQREALERFQRLLEAHAEGFVPCCCLHHRKLYVLCLVDGQGDTVAAQLDEVAETLRAESPALSAEVQVSRRIDRPEHLFFSFSELRYQQETPALAQRKQATGKMSDFELEDEIIKQLGREQCFEAISLFDELLDSYARQGNHMAQRTCASLVVITRSLFPKIARDPTLEIQDTICACGTAVEVKSHAMAYMEELVDALASQRLVQPLAWVHATQQYIEEHFAENLTLDDLARQAGFSTYYFSKLFKSTFATNFIDYLTDIRIDKARDMLRDGRYSVKEVCFAIGYSEPNYFARVFKRVAGVSPSQYQKIMLPPQNSPPR